MAIGTSLRYFGSTMSHVGRGTPVYEVGQRL